MPARHLSYLCLPIVAELKRRAKLHGRYAGSQRVLWLGQAARQEASLRLADYARRGDTFRGMDIMQRLLGLLLTARYQVTDHAMEALDDDRLTVSDLICGVGTGRIRKSWAGARKYEIEGRAIDGRLIRIVIRLIDSEMMRIITVYEVR